MKIYMIDGSFKGIASTPIEENIHAVGSYSGLMMMKNEIVNGICDSMF